MSADRTIRVWRQGAGRDGAFEDYLVRVTGPETVLDALEAIRLEQAPGLAYRRACHHASCGTCACRINGQEKLACVTRLVDLPAGPVVLEPLAGFEVVADLAVDPAPLFRDIDEEWSYLRRVEEAAPGTGDSCNEGLRLEDCIECGLCSSACPVVRDVPGFVGPAALAALSRELEKRPDAAAALLGIAASERGEALCARHLACSRCCPTGVAPAKHIFLLRRRIRGG